MTNRKKYLLIGSALFAIAALAASWAVKPKTASVSGIPADKRSAAQRVEDAIFVIDGRPVALNDGYSIVLESESAESGVVTRIFGLPVAADLDADGDMDSAVLLSQDTPGSGTFFYAAAAIKEDWGYRGTEAVLLGDRIAPQNIQVQDGVLIANYADRKPGEPMTAAPSVGVSKRFRVAGGELEEIANP